MDAARRVAVGTGAAVLVLSAFTDYETGIIRRIPMATHLKVDTVSDVLVAASPWLALSDVFAGHISAYLSWALVY